jgi:hypothetical protein
MLKLIVKRDVIGVSMTRSAYYARSAAEDKSVSTAGIASAAKSVAHVEFYVGAASHLMKLKKWVQCLSANFLAV